MWGSATKHAMSTFLETDSFKDYIPQILYSSNPIPKNAPLTHFLRYTSFPKKSIMEILIPDEYLMGSDHNLKKIYLIKPQDNLRQIPMSRKWKLKLKVRPGILINQVSEFRTNIYIYISWWNTTYHSPTRTAKIKSHNLEQQTCVCVCVCV